MESENLEVKYDFAKSAISDTKLPSRVPGWYGGIFADIQLILTASSSQCCETSTLSIYLAKKFQKALAYFDKIVPLLVQGLFLEKKK